MNPSSGAISLKTPVDFDTLGSNPISVVFQATDGGATARSATATVDITVTDVNDIEPTCTQHGYSVTVDEDSATSTSVRSSGSIRQIMLVQSNLGIRDTQVAEKNRPAF